MLEVARRCLGCILPIISLIFLAYSYFGRLIPGILGHRGYNLIINLSQSTSTSGIFGVSLTASAYYVFLLVLFSSFLMIGGAESFLIDISCSIAGKQRGGPAKIAVIASALFGTISGNHINEEQYVYYYTNDEKIGTNAICWSRRSARSTGAK